jgi:hypothetical protein
MSSLVPEPYDEPLSRSAMSRAAGISATTLENWTKRVEGPLETVRVGDADGFTWRLLLAFCASHPTLPGARQVRARYRETFSPAPAVSDQVALRLVRQTAATKAPVFADDDATLRAALENMKSAVDQNAAAVAHATELAAEAARTQQQLLHSLEQLTTAFEAWERAQPHGTA